MKNIFILLKLNALFILIGFITTQMSYAFDSNSIEQQANKAIKELYHTVNNMPNTSIAKRIDWFSAQFKGKPYLLGALGEGPTGQYDQFPRYRIDAFDCDTYVNTVLALVQANSLTSFQNKLNQTRYKDGKVTYIFRNHFTSTDWNQNNQKSGLLKDITLNIKDKNNKTVAQFAKALINKPAWYAHMQADTIRLEVKNQTEQNKRLNELKSKGKHLESILSTIPYLPFTTLFINKVQPNLHLFSQIPHGAIIEIVRPNWDLRQSIGTSLNVSHLGFAIWIKNKLYFRQASSQLGKVVDVPMIEYLKDAQKSPTIKGINVQIVPGPVN